MNEKMKRIVFSSLMIWLVTVTCNLVSAIPQITALPSISPNEIASTIVAVTMTAAAAAVASPMTMETSVTPSKSSTLASLGPTAKAKTVCPGPPGIGSFTVNHSAISLGSSVILSWSDVTNASSIQIDQGIGEVPASGSREVTPTESVTYTMTAVGCVGVQKRQVTVTVNPASGTCKGGYVYRQAGPYDTVCVLPASQAQAAADNAAADSRKIVMVYGMDACISGYVWREAYSGDHVCVTPAVRAQVAADNGAAAARWTSGVYGPHTCISGYEWREARSGDDICVIGSTRDQTAADNAAANSRKAVTVDGLDACISGYVWRAAFSGDHVCVIPSVRDQVAAENADAASHIWP